MVWEVRLKLFHSESPTKTILFVLKTYTFHEFFHLGTVSTTVRSKDFNVHKKWGSFDPRIISQVDHSSKHDTETKDGEDHQSDTHPVHPVRDVRGSVDR